MNKYTYEQRKMIAEYLRHEIVPMARRNEFGGYMIDCERVEKKMKSFETVTFGDIKNQIGTKFKLIGESDIYEVLPNQVVKNTRNNMEFKPIDEDVFSYIVEVINE